MEKYKIDERTDWEYELRGDYFSEHVLKHNGGVNGAVPKMPCKADPKSPFYDCNMPDHIPVSHFEYGKGKFADMFFKDEQGYEFSEGDFT